jgi:DNA-binding transcriptional ArsR family regulator
MQELKKELEIFDNINRLHILKYLKNKIERSVGDIADGAGVSFKTASRQLLYLAKKGILKRHYDGSFVMYRLGGKLSPIARILISQL